METSSTAIFILFSLTGSLFVGLAVPLIQRRVPPNRWYGFRVRKTLADPEIWYPANARSAWWMLGVGVAVELATVIGYVVPNVDPGTYAAVLIGVVLAGTLLMLERSFAYLRTLPDPERQHGT